MDKRTLIGVAVIALIMFGWMFYMSTTKQATPQEQQKQDTTNTQIVDNLPPAVENKDNTQVEAWDSVFVANKYGQYFSKFVAGTEQKITIETDYYTAIVSNKGATIVRWTLKKYNKWDGVPAQLIGYDGYELFMKFITTDAKKIDSRNLFFAVDNINGNHIKLTGSEHKDITFNIDLGDGKLISKKITFHGDKYHIDQDIVADNLDGILKGGYSLSWENSLNYQEQNSVDESSTAHAIVAMNGEIEEFDATESEVEDKSYTGIVDYVAIKTKYFTTAIIPQPWQQFDGTVDLSGHLVEAKKNGKVEKYVMGIRVPYKGGKQTNSFKVYIGPIDYELVKNYGLEATVDLGWTFLIRPIGEYVMLPLFNFIHNFVPNYGIVIILFSFIIKMLLYPLSIQQMRSASKMQLLAPEITKIREQYKDEPQKQQAETMKLYSEYSINPAGGCLPLLVQMPILVALWRVLNGTIDLRQQSFILWITDLSAPDKLFSWGFSILGMTHLSGLALLMAIAMFAQQKMTITDPRQKMMVYMMPAMFLIMFSNFPSGLNLYYFVFNLLSIAQQVYINKFSKKKLTLEDLKKQPKKKEGWIQKQMRQAQEMAAVQGKTLPPSLQKRVDDVNAAKGISSSNSQNKYRGNQRKKKK